MTRAFKGKKQKGMAALAITMTILAIITIITIFSARVIITDNKIYQNQQNTAYAFNAAQAGLDYAVAYLNANASTVKTGLLSCTPVTSVYSLSSGTLPNGSTYTMQYGCLTAGSTTYLSITAVGNAPGSNATRSINVIVRSYASGTALAPLVSYSSASVQNSAVVSNTVTGATYSVDAGGTVSTAGASVTPAAVLPNDSSIGGPAPVSIANFQTNLIGHPLSFFSSQPGALPYVKLSCSGSVTFNGASLLSTCTVNANTTGATTLSGITGAVIYVTVNNGTFTITQTGNRAFTLGTQAAPVILVVNNVGTFNIRSQGNATTTIFGNVYTGAATTNLTRGGASTMTINGLVFATGVINQSNSADVNGIVAGNPVSITDSGTTITYNSTSAGYISATLGGYVGSYASGGASGAGGSYGIVSGSWRDF